MGTRKLHFLLLGTFFLFLNSCSLFQKVTDNKGARGNNTGVTSNNEILGGAGGDLFEVQFVQNGEEATIENGIVTLDRTPFTIYLIMQAGDGVYLNASLFYDERFTLNNNFDDLADIYPKVMAEPTFNKDRELYLSDQNYSHWFYDENLDWHRLSDIRVVGNKVIGEKEVENLVFADENRSIPVQEIRDDLYLFFFAMVDTPSAGFSVKQRDYLKVEWR